MFGLVNITLVGAVTPVGLLAAGIGGLSAVYVICLIIGGGLLVVSLLFGGDSDAGVDADGAAGVDVDGDLDVDVAADAGPDLDVDTSVHGGHVAHDSASLASWLSVRFLIYFAATFGLVGTVLTYTTNSRPLMVLLVAFGAGLVIGQAVQQTVRYVQRTSGDSSTSSSDYVNRTGRVTIAIRPGQPGEVACDVRGGERFLPAYARRAEDTFAVGEIVGVVAFANGTAEVVSKKEFEFLHETERGGQV